MNKLKDIRWWWFSRFLVINAKIRLTKNKYSDILSEHITKNTLIAIYWLADKLETHRREEGHHIIRMLPREAMNDSEEHYSWHSR